MKYTGMALLFFVMAQISAGELGPTFNTTLSREQIHEQIESLDKKIRLITKESRDLREQSTDNTERLTSLANCMRKLHKEKEAYEDSFLRN